MLWMISTIGQAWIYRANIDLQHCISTVWGTKTCYTLWERHVHGCHPFQKNQELERRCMAVSDGFLKGIALQAVMVFWKSAFQNTSGHGILKGRLLPWQSWDRNFTAPKGGKMSPDLTLHWSHEKGVEVPIVCQASLLALAADNRFQWKSSIVSNLKDISKSIWLIAAIASHFCWYLARH